MPLTLNQGVPNLERLHNTTRPHRYSYFGAGYPLSLTAWDIGNSETNKRWNGNPRKLRLPKLCNAAVRVLLVVRMSENLLWWSALSVAVKRVDPWWGSTTRCSSMLIGGGGSALLEVWIVWVRWKGGGCPPQTSLHHFAVLSLLL